MKNEEVTLLFKSIKHNLEDIKKGKDYTTITFKNNVPGSIILSEGAGMDLFTSIKKD